VTRGRVGHLPVVSAPVGGFGSPPAHMLGPPFGVGPSFLYSDQGVAAPYSPTAFCAVPAQPAESSLSEATSLKSKAV